MTRKNEIYELKKKSKGLGFFLSFLIVGGGQLYAGKIGKGILLFFLSVILWFILMGWIIWIISMTMAPGDVEEANELLKLELGI